MHGESERNSTSWGLGIFFLLLPRPFLKLTIIDRGPELKKCVKDFVGGLGST